MNLTAARYGRFGQLGFTLIEVLVATALIVVFLIPATQSLRSVGHAGSETQVNSERLRSLDNRLESLLALSFETLAAAAGDERVPSTYSDPVSANPRKLVYISYFDGDATGIGTDSFSVGATDPELLWIRIAYAGGDDDLVTVIRK